VAQTKHRDQFGDMLYEDVLAIPRSTVRRVKRLR
jgi:hypothetical protein